jgi:twitching motility protein PilT
MHSSIATLLSEMARKNASDLHLGVGFPPAFRLDGELHFATHVASLSVEDIWRFVGELLSQAQIDHLKRTKELDFSFSFDAQETPVRFRGNCYFEKGNITIALRLITSNIRSLKQLQLPECLEGITRRLRGLFLVTGPTGSGKSTTLAAMVQQINMTRRCHIVTIEDPIEYLFVSERAMIHQREVGTDTESFGEALRRALRQDPDVILIGELRDLETMAAAVTAAETGHLVLATLHTPDAAQTVDRIIDVFPPHQQQQVRLQVSNVLVGVCSQQLIALPGGGRMAATEILLANPAVRNCIREGKTGQLKSILQTSAALGMHSMDQDLARLVREGKLRLEQAMSHAYEPKDLERLVFDTI